jgi:serine/threonine protein kinase
LAAAGRRAEDLLGIRHEANAVKHATTAIDVMNCPPANQLQAFSAAALPRASMDAVEEHITRCQHCLLAVEAWDEQSDALVQALVTLPCVPDDEAAFQSLHAALLSHCESIPLADCPTASYAPTSAPVADEVPEQLGGYQLLELLGQGATGAVFRARHVKLDRIVAMKVLNTRYVGHDARAVRRFQEEMRAVGKLDHSHIVRATDAGEADGRHFLVMEYVDGIDASRLLRRTGPLRVADACEIARQAALALEVAHRHNLVHRDVKPSNLLFTFNGQIKLLDLGLVRSDEVAPEHSQLWQTDIPHGTADYMPPEQWSHFASVDARADLYALGCTLYKLLTGMPLYPRDRHDYDGKRRAHQSAPIPWVRDERPEVPLGLQKILGRLLAKRPEDRYDSAADVAERLAVYAQGARLAELGARAASDTPDDLGQVSNEPTLSPASELTGGHRATRRQLLTAGAASVVLAAACWRLWPSKPPVKLRVGQWRTLQPSSGETTFPLADGTLTDASTAVAAGDQSAAFSVSTPHTTLFHFGQPVKGRFAMRTTIACEAPFDRLGIFFKYRPHRTRTALEHPFQVIELAPGEVEGFQLLWSHYRFYENADASYELEYTPWAEASIEFSPPSQPGQLEVTLGRTGFPEVSWNGTALHSPEWTISWQARQASGQTRDALQHAYLGQLGVFARAATASFSQLQLLYLDEQETA